MLHHLQTMESWDLPLVLHLLTPWWLSDFDPHTWGHVYKHWWGSSLGFDLPLIRQKLYRLSYAGSDIFLFLCNSLHFTLHSQRFGPWVGANTFHENKDFLIVNGSESRIQRQWDHFSWSLCIVFHAFFADDKNKRVSQNTKVASTVPLQTGCQTDQYLQFICSSVSLTFCCYLFSSFFYLKDDDIVLLRTELKHQVLFYCISQIKLLGNVFMAFCLSKEISIQSEYEGNPFQIIDGWMILHFINL